LRAHLVLPVEPQLDPNLPRCGHARGSRGVGGVLFTAAWIWSDPAQIASTLGRCLNADLAVNQLLGVCLRGKHRCLLLMRRLPAASGGTPLPGCRALGRRTDRAVSIAGRRIDWLILTPNRQHERTKKMDSNETAHNTIVRAGGLCR
jgi:hypothetical protein